MTLSQRIAQLAEAIGKKIADTGWVTVALPTGMTGYLRCRRIGAVTYISGNVSGAFVQGETLIAYLPAEMLPVGGSGPARFWSPGEEVGVVSVLPSGRVTVILGSATSRGNVNFSATFAANP